MYTDSKTIDVMTYHIIKELNYHKEYMEDKDYTSKI